MLESVMLMLDDQRLRQTAVERTAEHGVVAGLKQVAREYAVATYVAGAADPLLEERAMEIENLCLLVATSALDLPLPSPGEVVVVSERLNNGFIPGVRQVGQLKDPAHPCLGAVPRKHSHFFTKTGSFGSLGWTGEQVDDGRYTLKGTNRIVIHKEFPSVTFTYAVTGKQIRFTPLIAKTCSTFRCAWSLSMAIPGTPWTRR
jgi:hypothetical protein